MKPTRAGRRCEPELIPSLSFPACLCRSSSLPYLLGAVLCRACTLLRITPLR